MVATTTNLGRVGGELAEALAWLNSPARIAGEIARLEQARSGGDLSAETAQLLADWREVQAAQARLVGGQSQQATLDLTGASAGGGTPSKGVGGGTPQTDMDTPTARSPREYENTLPREALGRTNAAAT